jgi:hypothetical protein
MAELVEVGANVAPEIGKAAEEGARAIGSAGSAVGSAVETGASDVGQFASKATAGAKSALSSSFEAAKNVFTQVAIGTAVASILPSGESNPQTSMTMHASSNQQSPAPAHSYSITINAPGGTNKTNGYLTLTMSSAGSSFFGDWNLDIDVHQSGSVASAVLVTMINSLISALKQSGVGVEGGAPFLESGDGDHDFVIHASQVPQILSKLVSAFGQSMTDVQS